MTDLHLVGLPRTGTSFSFYYFTRLLRQAGLEFTDMWEPSNNAINLVQHDVGFEVTGIVTTDRNKFDQRLQMYDSFSHRHRLIKHSFHPSAIPYLDRWMSDHSAKWIEVKRNQLERYLSWYIARHTNVWVTTKQDVVDKLKQELRPFDVSLDELKTEIGYTNVYNEYRYRLINECDCIGIINYESMVADCVNLIPSVLKTYGLDDTSYTALNVDELEQNELLTRKMLTLDEKKQIIRNWQEVEQLLENS